MANVAYDKARCRVIDLSAHPIRMMAAIHAVFIDGVTYGGNDGQLFMRLGVSAMVNSYGEKSNSL